MRPSRRHVVVVGTIALAIGGVHVGSGCRDATQVTLEIGLSPRAQCNEIVGTSISVGIDQMKTEQRPGFVSASTKVCDPGTRAIGTLVVTPSDENRASIIVVVGYGSPPDKCIPPRYPGCIVARRHFAFAEHQKLRMPITIDPECKDVPCDAFSTCRTGKCFASSTTCNGDVCEEPGTSPDAPVVIPDAGDDGSMMTGDSGPDGGADAADAADAADSADAADAAEAGDPLPYCQPTGEIHCHDGQSGADVECMTPMTCCNTAQGPARCVDPAECSPGSPRFCCSPLMKTCALQGESCVAFGQTGQCAASNPGGTMCTGGVLTCPGPGACQPGTTMSCCGAPGMVPSCSNAPMCPVKGDVRYCCTTADCNGKGACPVVIGDGPARQCLGGAVDPGGM